MPSPTPDTDTTQELHIPKEWLMDDESSLSKGRLKALAKQFLLDEFAASWDVDSAQLSEWLADHNPEYAALTDEDDIDVVIEDFTMEVDAVVRQAISDFKLADEVVRVQT